MGDDGRVWTLLEHLVRHQFRVRVELPELGRVVLCIHIVPHSHKLLTLVRRRQEYDRHPYDVVGRDLAWVGRGSLFVCACVRAQQENKKYPRGRRKVKR